MTKRNKNKRRKNLSSMNNVQNIKEKIENYKLKIIKKHSDTVVDIISFLAADDLDKVLSLIVDFENTEGTLDKMDLLENFLVDWEIVESAVLENFSLEFPEIDVDKAEDVEEEERDRA